MARTATEKTPIQKAADDAREAFKNAKAKNAEKETETTKKALEHAKAHMAEAVKAENRERFKNVVGARTAKAIVMLKNLRNASVRRSYEYSADDVAKMFKAIGDELAATRAAFDNALKSTTTTKGEAPAAFSFD